MTSVQYCVLTLVLSCAVSSYGALYKGFETPTYTVLNSTQDWELRRYPPTKWVSTNVTRMSPTVAWATRHRLFFRLFNYLNESVPAIPMTTPVITKVVDSTSRFPRNFYEMSFLLPKDQWESPKTPHHSNVYIQSMPQMDIFVKTFGGWATRRSYLKKAESLKESVSRDNYVLDIGYFYQVSYDAPLWFKRRNEVWMTKVEFEVMYGI